MRMNKFGLLAIALAFVVVGCAPMPVKEIWTKVPYGIIKTEGVIIESVVGRGPGYFIMRSGERFKIPIEHPFAPWHTWDNGRGSPPGMPDASAYRDTEVIGNHACLTCRLVRVTVPGKSDKLYGILQFSKMHPDARGPGTRSYLIQIPQRYIDEARDGRVSVVYETVTRTDGKKQAGWVLWLSDMPITDCPSPCF